MIISVRNQGILGLFQASLEDLGTRWHNYLSGPKAAGWAQILQQRTCVQIIFQYDPLFWTKWHSQCVRNYTDSEYSVSEARFLHLIHIFRCFGSQQMSPAFNILNSSHFWTWRKTSAFPIAWSPNANVNIFIVSVAFFPNLSSLSVSRNLKITNETIILVLNKPPFNNCICYSIITSWKWQGRLLHSTLQLVIATCASSSTRISSCGQSRNCMITPCTQRNFINCVWIFGTPLSVILDVYIPT